MIATLERASRFTSSWGIAVLFSGRQDLAPSPVGRDDFSRRNHGATTDGRTIAPQKVNRLAKEAAIPIEARIGPEGQDFLTNSLLLFRI